MIDVFIEVNTPIADIRQALNGFACNRVLIRNGGPTEVWQRTGNVWAKTRPGMCLFEDLCSKYVGFFAYYGEGCGMLLVEGFPELILSHDEAREWLSSMRCNHYKIEDAIGSSVGVTVDGREIHCASADIAISEFKSFHYEPTALNRKILDWTRGALSAGADQISAAISINPFTNN